LGVGLFAEFSVACLLQRLNYDGQTRKYHHGLQAMICFYLVRTVVYFPNMVLV
jgi:hypothetical protein